MGRKTLSMIATISNSAIPKLMAAPFPDGGGVVHESKVIPTAVVDITRRTLSIRDLPGAVQAPGKN
jgi:hypothetical protein